VSGRAPSAAQLGRVTPWELIFAGERFENEVFPGIQAEAEARGADLADPDAFALLGTVGQLLRELPVTPDPAAIRALAALLFQAFHFWRFGARAYAIDPALLDALTDAGLRTGEWSLQPPHPAGYVQLPRHRMWSRIDAASPAEPVDGVFWTLIGRDDPDVPPFRRLDALLVLGIHPERAGLSVVEASALVPSTPPDHWADIDARENGKDFENVLPGGQLSNLYALTNVAEVLELISRFFRFVAQNPAAVGSRERDGQSGEAGSRLPIRVVRMSRGADDG
jgi:hypothetical protein